MDFTFTEEQETIAKLAREVCERRATPERLTELQTGVRFELTLGPASQQLARLGATYPEGPA